MYRSHSTLGEREVPVRDFTAGPERPKAVRVITRLNIGGATIHTLVLTREMAALEYGTVLVAGSCEPEDGDMRFPLPCPDPVHWMPVPSRPVRPSPNLK